MYMSRSHYALTKEVGPRDDNIRQYRIIYDILHLHWNIFNVIKMTGYISLTEC